MNLWNNFLRMISRKESRARIAASVNSLGQPQVTPANYDNFAKEGFQKNATVRRSVELISKAASSIPVLLFRKENGEIKEVLDHPLLDLLERPNPLMGYSQFIEAVLGFLSISGNSYINAVGPTPGAEPMELWPVNAGKMEVVPGANGFPQEYVFTVNGEKVVYRVDFVNMKSEILHLKTFNPTNLWYGMSPLESVLYQVDQQTAANKWNLSLLQNNASPSGILTVGVSELNPLGTMTPEQRKELEDQITERHTGFKNTSKPMLLEGGLTWQQMGFNPKDMEYSNMKNMSTREIANVFGVPPLMLNISGDNTFANYKEARLAFYEDTIIPIMVFLMTEFNNWLTPIYGPGLFLDFDRDKIEALSEKRAAKLSAIKDANFLTQNEKREVAGFDSAEGWDVFVVNNEILPGELDDDFFEEPEPSEPTPAPVTEDDDDDAELEDEAEKSMEIKFFNPINRRERRISLKRQTRLKRQLEAVFEEDLAEDFKTLTKRMKKTAEEVDRTILEFALLKVIDETMSRFEDSVRKNLRRSMRLFGDSVFGSAEKHLPDGLETKASRKSRLKFSQFVETFIERRAGENITQIAGTTRKKTILAVRDFLIIQEQDPNFDVAKAVETLGDDFSKGRAATIARTETQMATQNASEEAVKSLEIPNMMKEWVPTLDAATRDDSGTANHAIMLGERVGLDEKFLVPPDALMNGPGDPSAPAEQVINCRCALVFNSGN